MEGSRKLDFKTIGEHVVPFSKVLSHANDYLIVELETKKDIFIESAENARFDGLIFLCCVKGSFSILRGFDEVPLTERNFMAIYPDDVIKGVVKKKKGEEGLLAGLFLTREFLRELNFNLNVFNSLDNIGRRTNVIKLDRDYFNTLAQYFLLLKLNAEIRSNPDNDIFTRNIARNITAALFYYLMFLTTNTRATSQTPQTSRRISYVLDFMALLQKEYKRHRTVRYYSDKMCISSKYLSRIIKESTGKSAAEWIDECVLIEAKNLLRFSGMNVQQVAYELNFTNQSTFGKFFKHLTGMSPSVFQNS